MREIKKKNPRRVLLQVPEGLVTVAGEIADRVGCEVIISLDPCYGACDLRDSEAKRLGCDLLVHLGHSPFGIKEEVPTIYIPWKLEGDVKGILEKEHHKIKDYRKIGLVTTVNFLHMLEEVRSLLEEKGHEVLISKGSRTRPGQVLGCDLGAALNTDPDAYFFFGSGRFHPLGIAMKTEKPVFSLDVEMGTLEKVDPEGMFRERYAAIGRAGNAEVFGILISTKPGQVNYELARGLKEFLESKGKKVYIFSMDRITPEKLLGLKVDCFVNTACPRIAVENRKEFEKPVLNPDEVMELFSSIEKI